MASFPPFIHESTCAEPALSCLRTPLSLAAPAAGGARHLPALCSERAHVLLQFGRGPDGNRLASAQARDPADRAPAVFPPTILSGTLTSIFTSGPVEANPAGSTGSHLHEWHARLAAGTGAGTHLFTTPDRPLFTRTSHLALWTRRAERSGSSSTRS